MLRSYSKRLRQRTGRQRPRRTLGGFALLGLALSTSAASQSPVVTSTTTYEYEDTALRARAVRLSSTDGAYRRTETTFAHEVYPAMEERNMLAQVYEQRVRPERSGEVPAPALSCERTTWREVDLGEAETGYVPSYSHVGCGEEESIDLHYAAYDERGRLTNVRNSGGLSTFLYFGTEAQPFSQNTDHDRLTGVRQTGYGVGGAGWDFIPNGPPSTGDSRHERAYTYDTAGRVRRHVDRSGVVTSYAYDDQGRLTTVLDAAGAALTSHAYRYSAEAGAYDPANPNWTEVTVHTGTGLDQRVRKWADGLGRTVLTQTHKSGVYDWLSGAEYDELGRPGASWNSVVLGSKRRFVSAADYQAATRAYYARHEGNGMEGDANRPFTETTYERSPLQRPTYVRFPGERDEGVRTRYGVARPDARSALLGGGYYSRPEGPAPQMAYVEIEDADGRRTRVYSDALGHTRFTLSAVGTVDETLTETVYDAAGRPVETRPPLFFQPRDAAHNVEGQVTRVNDEALATMYRHDTRGLLLEQSTPDGGTTRYAYDRAGRLRYQQDADEAASGRVRYFRYDALGRLVTEGIGLPNCTWEQLDPHYEVDDPSTLCPDLVTGAAHFEWSGALRANLYDDPADNTMASDPKDLGLARVRGWPWFAPVDFPFARSTGRLAATAYKSNGRWQSEFYAYDERGRLAERWTNTQGLTHPIERSTYAYDRAGRRTHTRTEVGPYAYEERTSYDARGAVSGTWSGAGEAAGEVFLDYGASYQYAPDGHPTSTTFEFVDWASPGRRLHRAYDVRGRLVQIGQPDGSETMYTGTSGTVSKSGGTLAGMLIPSPNRYAPPFSARYSYSAAGLVEAAQQLTPYAAQGSPYVADKAARQARYRSRYRYDGLGRLTAAEYDRSGASSYLTRGLRYDANGNLLELERWAPTDPAHAAATGQAHAAVDHLSYTYEARSNRLRFVADAADAPEWAGAVWDADPAEFRYAADGRMRRAKRTPTGADGQRDYLYHSLYEADERDRPVYERLERTDGERPYARTRYGVGGRRIERAVTGAPSRRTLRDGERARAELTSGGELLRWHTPWGHLGATGGARYAGRAVWTDPLGSVRAVVDERGVVVQATDYYAFGLQKPGRAWRSVEGTRADYTGHELDEESGQHYAGARYYDAALARWHVIDPLWAQFPSHSPYNYVLGDPINLMDPDGMAPCCVDEGKAFVRGAVGAVSSRVNGAVNYVRGTTVEGVARDVYNNVLTNDGMSGGEYLDHLAQGPSLDEQVSDAYASTVAFVETSDSEQLAAAAGVVAVGIVVDRLTGGRDRSTPGAKSVQQQADDLVSQNGGRNRVTLRSENTQLEIDLAGRSHGGVPTPHTKTSTRNHRAPNQPAYNTKRAPVTPTTQQEVRTARKYLERKNKDQ